jgi:WhiB family redox-sensing transcriptional regulator
LADSLDNEIEFGVWGGMTERERRALLRRRPDVRSWRTLLETARLEHSRTDYVTIPAQQVVADMRSPQVDLRSRTSVA